MRYNKLSILFVILILLFTIQLNAEGNKNNKTSRLSKTNGSPSRTHFNINNISTWIYNDGNSDIAPNQNSGLVFPKGSNKTAIFQSGFVWGANVNGEKRVGGSTYQQGLMPGRILPSGKREIAQPGDGVRIYRVRPDWIDGDLSSEVNDGEGSEDEVRAQYEKDWNEWPAEQGAPYEDVNNNGIYDAGVDIPGFPGASQTIWFVANDLDTAQCRSLYGSDPMGIEMQATIWGYNSSSALGNTMFRKYVIINKSDAVFDSMYVSMWSDPDVGDAGDDFSGCDVEKSLMYTYNGKAKDATYGLTPPAVGFDFFQGPIVPATASDTAIFNNKKIGGYKNLPMSAHYFFINGDPIFSDPDLNEYVTGTLQFHNLFRGRISTTGSPFADPVTEQPTKFTLSGDPITGQGWVDGIMHPPGDRRQGMVAGPFTMAPGDTQEVVVGELAAGTFGNVDRLAAVQLLKFYDLEAQATYDNFFKVPATPVAPDVKVTEIDKEIILNWDDLSNSTVTKDIEEYNALGYKFQGYVVYQYPSKFAQKEDAKIVATYDLDDGIGKVIGPQFDVASATVLNKVLKFGSDSGIKRYITIKKDLFNGGAKFNNGTPYYFAVTSYAVHKDLTTVPSVLESESIIHEVFPQTFKPGESTKANVGDYINVKHIEGNSDAVVKVKVISPKDLTGDEYRVDIETYEIYTNTDTGVDTSLGFGWSVFNITKNTKVTPLQKNLTGIENSYIIVDGLQIIVPNAAAGIKGDGDAMVEVAYEGTPLISDKYDESGLPYNGNKVWHSLNSNKDYYVSAGGGSGGMGRLTRYVDYASPRDFELRFTSEGGFGVYPFDDNHIAKVPFELWDIGINTIDDPSDDKRMIPFIVWNDTSSSKTEWNYNTGKDPYFKYPASDWIYWMDPAPGTNGYADFAAQCEASGGAGAIYQGNNYFVDFYGGFVYPWGRMIICDFAEDGTPPPAGTTIRIITNKPLTVDDKYVFTAPAFDYNSNNAASDVEKINVFPNPYYGINPNEINKYQRFVTFNHLPQKAKLRIFNLGGHLVKTINKNDETQFAKWDLKNETNLPAASGIYVVYIDMPELGKTKILKVAIIQETQILDRF